MNFKREDIEVLAPVGSFESLEAAIQGGANAIYFGIEQLNMRAKSSYNFTKEDLPVIIKRAKENNLKTYLTVNTVIYDKELNTVKEIIELAKKEQVDALIASDISVLNYANIAGVPAHLSTQLNISNVEALSFYSRFADVAVLARELSLEQVKNISDEIKNRNITGPKGQAVRLEMFVHGALCMAISGKCYLSLHEHNHSANRGDCLQVCRRAYVVTDKERGNELEVDNEYIMSPKDLSTIHFLNKILDSGVRVLKIEGRARSPEYVKTVTRCYSEAIDSIIDGSYGQEKIDEWKKSLSKVFNRGFWDGYYLGQRLGEWSHIYGSQASHKKVYTGKITNYFDKIGVAEVQVEAGELNVGDNLIIMGPTTGVVEIVLEEIQIDHKSISAASKGQRCSFPIKTLIRRSDKVYRLIETKRYNKS
ncbi:MAG: U32 family peptidase [Bacteroidales bacterium]|nr:U32 family peptidase [Bacteroidales bacterium]MCF8389646.1 U32 family peptidase [Bacteroidales bacterium]